MVQLGDAYELWAGLAFAHDCKDPGTRRELISYWLAELTQYSTPPQARLLRHLDLTVNEFLAENHDDYLVQHGRRTTAAHGGLMLQHGHQAGDFNNWANHHKGHAVTQAATRIPALRNIEGAIIGGWKAAKQKLGFGGLPSRLELVLHAARRCILDSGWKHGVYAMGHTHNPTVKLLHLRSGNPDRHGTPKGPNPLLYKL